MTKRLDWDSKGEFQIKNHEDALKGANLQMEISSPGFRAKDLAGIKHDADKVRYELLQWVALEEVAKVMTYGAKKYEDWNWTKGFKYSRVIGAAFRHLTSWVKGDDRDAETGLSHLAHAACCVLFLLTFELTGTGQDDRFKYGKTG